MIKLTFLGDIMCDYTMTRQIGNYRNKVSGLFDFSPVFSNLRKFLEMSDYTFANLETPIALDDENLTSKKWTFNSPIEFAKAVKECGVDFVSTANNHCLDRGLEGIEETIKSLELVGLEHCGIQTDINNCYRVINAGKLRIGVLAYTYGTNAFSNHCYLPKGKLWMVNLLQAQEGRIERLWNSVFKNHLNSLFQRIDHFLYSENEGKQAYEKETFKSYRKLLVRKTIRRLKKERTDYIVAYLHIGGQYNSVPSLYTRRVADWFIKKGCKIVICNHEHVVHEGKVVDGNILAYALGNCLGSAGVIEGPYDRNADYSVALHTYVDEETNKVTKATFSILRTILKEGRLEVWPVYDLHKTMPNGEEKELLLKDTLDVAYVFSGKRFETMKEEYLITKEK